MIRPYVGRLLIAGLLGALTDLAGLALLASATWLLATAAGQPPLAALTLAIVGVRAFALARGVGRYVERLAGHDAALRLLAELRTRIYAAIAREEPARRTPDLLARLVSDVDSVQDLVLRCALPAGVAVLVSGTAVGVAAVLLPSAAAVLAAALLLGGLALPYTAYRVARRAGERSAQARADLTTASVDAVQGAADLIAGGAAPDALARTGAAADRVASLERSTAVAQGLLAALAPALSSAAALGVALVSIPAVAEGRLGGPAAAVLILGALAAVEAVTPLIGAAVRYAELRGSLARVFPLLRPDGEPVPDLSQSPPATIALTGVVVRYPDRSGTALDGIDLSLPPGRRVAIVGPSGAGKSTLLAVVAGIIRPVAGTATVPAVTWPVVSGVFGDRHVFHATVRENLALGRPEIADEALATALGIAGLTGWAARLDDVVGEDGGQVSGGERQRLLLARGLAQAQAGASDVLLWDEPTEGLDPTAADEVLGAVLAASGGRTVVLVTHRLAPIAVGGFDEILVLDRGRVVQRGTHRNLLLDEAGWYADEWRAQHAAERRYARTRSGS